MWIRNPVQMTSIKTKKVSKLPNFSMYQYSMAILQRGMLFLPRTTLWHLHFYKINLTYECQWLEEVQLNGNDNDIVYVAWSINQSINHTA
jgi:hypothetical protein